MKIIYLFIMNLLLLNFVFGQMTATNAVTKEVIARIDKEVKIEVLKYKATLIKQNEHKEVIEFAIDTFRINRINEKREEVNNGSTYETIYSIIDYRTSYEKLMNKYFSKLLKSLKADEKDALIEGQKAWKLYRKSEEKLAQTVASGGGTLQHFIVNDFYTDIVVERTNTLYKYYYNYLFNR